MGGTYQAGEEKVRPGVYRRYTTQDKKLVAGAMTGVFAIPVKADFGPVGTVTIHTKQDSVKEMYGMGGTVKGALNLFRRRSRESPCISSWNRRHHWQGRA